MALAISSLIVIANKFFQKNINKNIVDKNKIEIKIKSKLFINNIFQNNKEFISSWRFQINQIKNIHPAIQVWEIISLVDSFVINLVFSIKNINKLAIIQNIIANK